jgi:hypothetical protein
VRIVAGCRPSQTRIAQGDRAQKIAAIAFRIRRRFWPAAHSTTCIVLLALPLSHQTLSSRTLVVGSVEYVSPFLVTCSGIPEFGCVIGKVAYLAFVIILENDG